MRPRLLALAAGILLVADAVLLLRVAAARRGAPEAELRLSERELTLPDRDEENSALALRLNWWGPLRNETLDAAKLAALGFDTASHRPAAKAVYVVLELTPTALVRADAGRDPALLRARYPDRRRYAIAAAVARMWGNRRPGTEGGFLAPASASVYVPPQYMHVFRGLTRTTFPVTDPRYDVSLCYDRNGDPWICGASRRR